MRQAVGVDSIPILRALVRRGCRFVVVGSTARLLVGVDVVPNDLDIVVADEPDDRRRLLAAFADIEASLPGRRSGGVVSAAFWLAWEWSWDMDTAYGPVDVIVRFIDGSAFESHDVEATTVLCADGMVVRCRQTEHV
jgi:hypothetical protein